MNKIESYLTINPYSRPGIKLSSVRRIVIHWVGNAGSSAIANRNYFESLKDKHIYASSQYIIGLNGEIIQCMPENEVAWHSGNYEMNLNSIGIENCHPDWSGKFNENTYNTLIELIADICRKYGLDQNAIVRHYDVTGKDCPRYYVENNWAFEQLKKDVADKLGREYIPDDSNNISVNDDEYDVYKVSYMGTNIRTGPSLNSSVAYQKNAGEDVYVIGQENGFHRLTDGNYIRIGFAYKVSTGIQRGENYKVLYNGTNIRTASSLNSKVAYLKNSGDIIKVVGTENDFYRLSDGNYIRIGYAELVESSNDNNVYIMKYRVSYEYPNIRSGPSLNSPIVRVIPKDTIINVIGIENGFLKLDDGTYLKDGFAVKI